MLRAGELFLVRLEVSLCYISFQYRFRHVDAKFLTLVGSQFVEALADFNGFADLFEMEAGLIPFLYLSYSLARPSIVAKPAYVVDLDVSVCQFGKENFHLVVEAGVVCRRTDDEPVVAEHVADNIRVVCL